MPHLSGMQALVTQATCVHSRDQRPDQQQEKGWVLLVARAVLECFQSDARPEHNSACIDLYLHLLKQRAL